MSPFAKVAVSSTVKWPSNLRRQLAAAGGAEARADAEAKERARRVTELQALIRHARLPIVSVAETTNWPGSAWAGIAQGLRARTIRRRVKDWAKASRYFITTTGHPWPQSLGVFLDYLQVLCDGGFLHRLSMALSWRAGSWRRPVVFHLRSACLPTRWLLHV